MATRSSAATPKPGAVLVARLRNAGVTLEVD